jgi:spermidine synthase/MFS family permease
MADRAIASGTLLQPRVRALEVDRAGGLAMAALAFLASAATLVLELVAGRMMAPFIGVSLYTWTAVIGVILAGVSLGNWLGGRLADRRASSRILGLVFIAGGVLSLATLAIVGLLGDGGLFRPLPLLVRIFLLTTLVFLAPSLVLGMVTPLAIRLSLLDVRRTGRVVGLIYAAGTLGSLVGNFLTGFVLTAYLPVNAIVSIVGCLLLLTGAALCLVGQSDPRPESADIETAPPTEAAAADLGPQPSLGLSLGGNLPGACAVVIVSSFCTMTIELAASRILAPTLGLSLYSWTGIIGAVLAGIAVGNFLGGRLADRWSSQTVLGLSLLAGGLASLAILLALALLQADLDLVRWLQGLRPEWASQDWSPTRLMGKIVTLTVVIFFVPVLLLGTISPQVIRLAVTDLRRAGEVSGKIYAWSTFGAIVGTFATGWWLISALGVHALVFWMGVILLLLALVVGRFQNRPLLLGAALVAGVGLSALLVSRGALASNCVRETNYYCLKVYEDVRNGVPVRSLVLDHLIHSYVKLGDPSYLGYEHEYVQAEITRYEVARTGQQRVLVIGGGGYTYPRWVEWAMPQTTVEVVEIDPGVTEVVYDYLGLPRETLVVSHNMDGRQFVHESAQPGSYALVVQDAVNDLSVPYHIMTKEYNDQIKAVLAPDGAYLLTVIDLYRDGQLLRAAARTMRQSFPSVQLLAASRSWELGGANVWVIAGSEHGIELDRMRELLNAEGAGPMRTVMLEPELLAEYIADGPQIMLTDQYAPVDNLIAPLFTRRG